MAEQTLIERLTAAKEGTRELSDEVLLARGWTITKDRGPQALYISPGNDPPVYQVYAPDPTRSLDDWKRWCVPEGLTWGVSNRRSGEGVWTATIEKDSYYEFYSRALTPALALCIAGMKAREAGSG